MLVETVTSLAATLEKKYVYSLLNISKLFFVTVTSVIFKSIGQFKLNANCEPDAVNVSVWAVLTYTYVPVVLSNLTVVVIPLTGLFPNLTLNVACLPPSTKLPLTAITGAD